MASLDLLIYEKANKYGLPPKLLRELVKKESNFNPKAKSPAGAMGLTQLMPGTAKSLGVTDPWDPEQNLEGGAKYLRQQLDKFGRVDLALAAYNAGPGNVEKYGGIPPFAETRNYVSSIINSLGDLSTIKPVSRGTQRPKTSYLQQFQEQYAKPYTPPKAAPTPTATKSKYVSTVDNVNPEFAAKHPTFTKIAETVTAPIRALSDLPWFERAGQTGSEIMTLQDRPDKVSTGSTAGDITADLWGSLMGFAANPAGTVNVGANLFNLGTKATEKVLPKAVKSRPILNTAAGLAGGAVGYEGAAALVNNRPMSLQDMGVAAAVNALLGAATHGVARMPKLARAANQAEQLNTIRNLDLRNPVRVTEADRLNTPALPGPQERVALPGIQERLVLPAGSDLRLPEWGSDTGGVIRQRGFTEPAQLPMTQAEAAARQQVDNVVNVPLLTGKVDTSIWQKGVPERKLLTGKTADTPLDTRTFDEVGRRSIKAASYEHPELAPFIRQEANRLMGEVMDTIKGERTYTEYNGEAFFSGTKRLTSESIERIKDETGASYVEIGQALGKLVHDKGLENNALSKKIELIIDDNLTRGTKTIDGMDLPPVQEYIVAKQKAYYSKPAAKPQQSKSYKPVVELNAARGILHTTKNLDRAAKILDTYPELKPQFKSLVKRIEKAQRGKANAPRVAEQPQPAEAINPRKAELAAARVILRRTNNPERAAKVIDAFPDFPGLRAEYEQMQRKATAKAAKVEKAKAKVNKVKTTKEPKAGETKTKAAPKGAKVAAKGATDAAKVKARKKQKRASATPVDDGVQAMASPAAPPPGGGKTDKTVKRRDIIKFLDEKLNVPIRTGRFKQKALGIFKIKPEVIRSRIANDIPAISHEVGHFLDKQLKLADSAFDSELMALGKQTSLPNYTPEQVRAEGVAEFVRLFLTDEAAAKKAAPKFFASFEQKIKANKDIDDALRTAQRDIYTWYNQPAKARILGSMSIGEKSSRKMSLDSLYTMTFDEVHPLKGFVRQVGVKDLPIEKDPYKLAWLARGWAGKAETLLKHGPMDKDGKKVGKSLDEILKTVENELDDFRAYIVAKHSLEVKAQGKETGIADKDALEVINNSPAKYQDTLNDLVKYQDNLLEMLADAGVMKKGSIKAMREAYPNYIPFYREFSDDPAVVTEWLSRGGYANLNNPIKKMKGSARDILDPLESIIKNTYLFTNIAEKNKVGRAIVELAEQGDGLGRFVEKVDGNRFSKENVLKVFRNGEPEHYQLDPDLYRATLALDKESTNTVVQILSYPASWLRAGAVLSPDFMVRNPIRDGFSAFINSKYGFIPGWDTVKGVFHAVKKDDLYWQWMNSGGAQSTLVSIDRDYLQKNIREMFKNSRSTKDKIITVVNPKTYLEMLRSLSEFTELGTRLGEFSKGVKSGANPLEAAIASRDVSIDFGRHGAHTKQVNRIIAFFNAALQGADKIRRQFIEKPLQTSVRTALSITAPSVLLYLHNRNDPRYQELPQWQKDMFWIIPTKEHLWRIPKPFEMGILFGTVPERILQWIDSKDPKAFDELGKTVLEGMLPGYLPTALLPIIEAQSNYSFFMKRPIVPQREQKIEPSEQFTVYTTETAKKLGELLNMSPRKIENTIRGYTGGLGMYTIKLGEGLAEVFGVLDRTSRPALTMEEIPGLKALMTTAYNNTQSENDFYERLDELERQYQTIKNLKQKPPKGFSMSELKRLRKVSDRLSDLRKRERDILNSKTMSPQRKRAELTKLNKLATNTARVALGKERLK